MTRTRRLLLPLLTISALLCLSGVARALTYKVGRKAKLDIKGQDRFDYLFLTAFPLDETGYLNGGTGPGNFGHVLRLSPAIRTREWILEAEADFAVVGHLYGTENELAGRYGSPIRGQADGLSAFLPRKLSSTWRLRAGIIQLGMTTSHWGMGLLANGGDRPTGEFSTPMFGDIVLRAGLVVPIASIFTRSWIAKRLFLAAALDMVFRDENADLVKGDTAAQGVFSLFYRHKGRLFAGFYTALRGQTDRDDTALNAYALDLYLRFSQPIKKRVARFELAAEGIFVTGWTDRIVNEAAPNGTQLKSAAAVGRAGVRFPSIGLRVGVEAGYASGDYDREDGATRQFRLDPDYQPSLILFRQLLGAVTARGADRAGDPDRVGIPVAGTDQYPTYGSMRNVFYLQPVAAYRPVHGPRRIRPLLFKVGFLWARSVSPLADPYNSYRDGGVDMTHMRVGAQGRTELGYEVDLSVSYRLKIYRSISLNATVLYGHFFAGPAFEDRTGRRSDIDMMQCRLTVKF